MSAATSKETGRQGVVWIHEVRVDDEVTFRVGRRDGMMIAEWPGLAVLRCTPDGTSSRLTPASGASRTSIEKLRHGHVKALRRDLAGQLGAHASAVAFEGRAVVFMGPSGAGKSTIAAQMCLRHGAELLADDVVLFDLTERGVRVIPGEREHWLDRNSCLAVGVTPAKAESSDVKQKVLARRVAHRTCDLALTVVLAVDPAVDRPELRSIPGGDAARLLLQSVIRFDVEDVAARRRELEQITRIFGGAPTLELVRPPGKNCSIAPLVIGALSVEGR